MMDAKKCGVYLVTHRESGRRYVGQSIDVDRRIREHSAGHQGTGLLCKAIKKHGKDAFEFTVIELCEQRNLNAAEVKWIAELRTIHPNGFNLTTGGYEYVFTDEVRARMSASKLGIPKSAEWRAKMSERQRQLGNVDRLRRMSMNQSDATRAKIAAAHRGKKVSAETKARISAGKLGKNLPPQTPEDRAKKSVAAKARWARVKAESMQVGAQ